MEIFNLEEGLSVYKFSPNEKDEIVGYNVLVIQHENECILVDTAFRRHFVQIEEDLNKKGLKITKVIFSHFHRDHIGGIPKLDGVELVGSIYAKDTLKAMFKDADFTKYLPTNAVINKKMIVFGKFKIDLIVNKGHSIDGLLVLVNNKYIFVGDDIIFNYRDEPLLPFCADLDAIAHINSLETIKSLVKGSYLIPSHGPITNNEEEIKRDIDNRISYLNYIIKNKDSSYIDFSRETNIKFSGVEWYKNNV